MSKEVKCVFCEGRAVLRFEELKLLGGKVVLNKAPYFHCNACKREFVNKEQMLATEKELKQKFGFNREVISTGRSLAITLPSDLTEFYHLKPGEKIQIIPESPSEFTVRIVS